MTVEQRLHCLGSVVACRERQRGLVDSRWRPSPEFVLFSGFPHGQPPSSNLSAAAHPWKFPPWRGSLRRRAWADLDGQASPQKGLEIVLRRSNVRIDASARMTRSDRCNSPLVRIDVGLSRGPLSCSAEDATLRSGRGFQARNVKPHVTIRRVGKTDLLYIIMITVNYAVVPVQSAKRRPILR